MFSYRNHIKTTGFYTLKMTSLSRAAKKKVGRLGEAKKCLPTPHSPLRTVGERALGIYYSDGDHMTSLVMQSTAVLTPVHYA